MGSTTGRASQYKYDRFVHSVGQQLTLTSFAVYSQLITQINGWNSKVFQILGQDQDRHIKWLDDVTTGLSHTSHEKVICGLWSFTHMYVWVCVYYMFIVLFGVSFFSQNFFTEVCSSWPHSWLRPCHSYFILTVTLITTALLVSNTSIHTLTFV